MNKVAKLVRRNVTPVFTHDCEACKFLGRLNGEDLYVCPNDGSYVRRFGNEPSDNGSLGNWTPEGSPYALARELHARRNTIVNSLAHFKTPHEWRA